LKKRAFFLRYRNIVFTVFGLLLLTYAVMRIVRPNSALIASFEIGRNVKQVAISPNANYVAALDYEGRVFWWNTSTKALIHQIEVKGIDFFDLVFSKDEKLIVTGDNLGFVRVFDVETGDMRFSEQVLTPDVAHIVLRVMDDGSTYPKQGGVFDLAMSNDGSLLMAGGVNGQVALISTNQWVIPNPVDSIAKL
jgi:WD40 repeat protein